MGGGTPSLMDPSTVGAILDGIAANWHMPDGIEITMEANPGTIEHGRFEAYAAAGINRVSLGAQSFERRRFAARRHNTHKGSFGDVAVVGGATGMVGAAWLAIPVGNSIADGVTYAVAAGNENTNACNGSPSRVAAALTVGSIASARSCGPAI